jgi:uncharacterized protein YcbK (DUF882 family)
MIWLRGDNKVLSPHFSTKEFECKCGVCRTQLIDDTLIEKLTKMRDDLSEPIKINSGYRCERWNAVQNGVLDSKHMHGQASDISVVGMNGVGLAKAAEKYFNRIGVANAWIHVDVAVGNARWAYPMQKTGR